MAGKKKVPTLERDTIVTKAIEMADKIGMESLSIRKLAKELDAGAMSIYYYFSSKDEIIDSMVDHVFREIGIPSDSLNWKEAIRNRCLSTREVLGRHPWASTYMESRKNPGKETLRHHDALIGCFLRGGFTMEKISRALAIVDAYVYGFALQEANLPGEGGDEMIEMGKDMMDETFKPYANLSQLTEYVLSSEYRFCEIFESGLDMILNSLEQS